VNAPSHRFPKLFDSVPWLTLWTTIDRHCGTGMPAETDAMVGILRCKPGLVGTSTRSRDQFPRPDLRAKTQRLNQLTGGTGRVTLAVKTKTQEDS
jgi:hypothetical protein